jgi:hypothetical protein
MIEMTNDNGNAPASPFTQKPEYQYQEAGLTKREHFAGLAPDNIPSWFHREFADSSDESLTWHREGNSYQIGECGWTKEGEIALYFAWRTYYADALLKELAK